MAGVVFANAASKDGNYNPMINTFNGTVQADNSSGKVAAITNSVLTTNVVTITTAAAHGYQVGLSVIVACVTNTVCNNSGTANVITGVTSTTFTYALTHANVTTSADTGTVTPVNQTSPSAISVNELDLVWPTNAVLLKVYPVLGAVITNSALTTNVATITAVAHGFFVGQTVTVKCVTATSLNGVFVIATVPTANTFTYALTTANVGSGADTGSVFLNPPTVLPGATLALISGGATLGTSQLPANTWTTISGVPGQTSFIQRTQAASVDFKFDVL